MDGRTDSHLLTVKTYPAWRRAGKKNEKLK